MTCLVTGATGFVGAALVGDLAEAGYPMRCVVRGATAGERADRLSAALGPRYAALRSRIDIVPGDLDRPMLGHSPESFAALGRGTGMIVHCGARVNMALPYASLHEPNVRATADLLGLAEAAGARFVFIGSLAAVAGTVRTEPFELLDPVRGGYGQSKWAADRLVSVAHAEGRVPATILRLGRVTADGRTGRRNERDLLENVLRICARLGVAPALPGRIRLSPVDWVSRTAVALIGEQRAAGRAFHVQSPATMSWAGAVATLRRAGYPIDELDYADWLSRVVAAGRDDPRIAVVAGSLDPSGLDFDRLEAPASVRCRAVLGARYRPAPEPGTLLERVVSRWQRDGILPAVAVAGTSGGSSR